MRGWNEAVFTELIEQMGVKGVQVSLGETPMVIGKWSVRLSHQSRWRQRSPSRSVGAGWELTVLYFDFCR